MNLKKFVLEGNPVCRKEAVIVGDHFRITMLTTALIRFEYSEDGGFEDRATQMVCNRDFPVPEFRVSDGGEELHIYTKDLEIHYDRQKFSPSGLSPSPWPIWPGSSSCGPRSPPPRSRSRSSSGWPTWRSGSRVTSSARTRPSTPCPTPSAGAGWASPPGLPVPVPPGFLA